MKRRWLSWAAVTVLMSLLFVGNVFSDEYPVVVEAEVRAVLSAEQEGVLVSLNVDVGDRVKKGDVIAAVFHDNYILKKEQHEAKDKYLTIQLDNLNKLSEKGLSTEEEVAKVRMDKAVNEKDMAMMQTMIARARIRAPFSGLIILRYAQPHEWVRPGQPVVEMYNPDRLRVVADIPADLAVKMKSGQKYTLFFPALNVNVTANLTIKAPQVDVRSNTVKVYWRVKSGKGRSNRLLPGMKGVLKLGSR